MYLYVLLKRVGYFFLGHIDHSARVMRVITWNRSFKGLANMDDGKDDFYAEEQETHATVLDKLLAWEKKLYDEVKVYGTQSFPILIFKHLFWLFIFTNMLRHYIISILDLYDEKCYNAI